MAALLNAGNNALNQIRLRHRSREQAEAAAAGSGLTIPQVWWFTNITRAAGARARVAGRSPGAPRVLLAGCGCRRLYYLCSVPPFRTKRLGIWANVTIAIPRGVLLKVAGWSSVKTIVGVEPWYRRDLRAVSARRHDDEGFCGHGGDRRGGCRTLPISGVTRAAWMISPSFVVRS